MGALSRAWGPGQALSCDTGSLDNRRLEIQAIENSETRKIRREKLAP